MTNRKQLGVVRLTDSAQLPTYGSQRASCFDIRADIAEPIAIEPGKSADITTGLVFNTPEGYEIIVHSRSGHGRKNGIRLANCTGVIDSDYRGELLVVLRNDSLETFVVQPGDRIAQAKVQPVEQWDLVENEGIEDTLRGSGGFGSTGVK